MVICHRMKNRTLLTVTAMKVMRRLLLAWQLCRWPRKTNAGGAAVLPFSAAIAPCDRHHPLHPSRLMSRRPRRPLCTATTTWPALIWVRTLVISSPISNMVEIQPSLRLAMSIAQGARAKPCRLPDHNANPERRAMGMHMTPFIPSLRFPAMQGLTHSALAGSPSREPTDVA